MHSDWPGWLIGVPRIDGSQVQRCPLHWTQSALKASGLLRNKINEARLRDRDSWENHYVDRLPPWAEPYSIEWQPPGWEGLE